MSIKEKLLQHFAQEETRLRLLNEQSKIESDRREQEEKLKNEQNRTQLDKYLEESNVVELISQAADVLEQTGEQVDKDIRIYYRSKSNEYPSLDKWAVVKFYFGPPKNSPTYMEILFDLSGKLLVNPEWEKNKIWGCDYKSKHEVPYYKWKNNPDLIENAIIYGIQHPTYKYVDPWGYS